MCRGIATAFLPRFERQMYTTQPYCRYCSHVGVNVGICTDILNIGTKNYLCVEHKMYFLADYWM